MNKGILKITSLQNEQVKNLVKLRQRRERDRRGLTLIEEPLVIKRALAANYPCVAAYFCPAYLDEEGRALLQALQAAAGLNLSEVTAPVMDKISYRDKPGGLLVVAKQQRVELSELQLKKPALLVVLEAVEKPGNLGAVLRIADGAGADAVILCGDGTDLFNPNVLRASRGAFFSVPTVTAATDTVLTWLATNYIRRVATSPAAADNWSDVDLAQPVAIMLGTEHDGLSAQLLNAADLAVSLPMLGAGDSLNLSTSAAVLLYEAVRQRTQQPRQT